MLVSIQNLREKEIQNFREVEARDLIAAQAAEIEALRAEVGRLAKALRDAAASMQTIAEKAGRDEYLMTTDEVRGYANSRANAARAALEQETTNG